MQYDQQEICYGLNSYSNVDKRLGISTQWKYDGLRDHEELRGKAPKQAHKHKEEMKEDFKARYDVYLGCRMLQLI